MRVTDDDEAGLVLSAASLEVPETGSAGYTVKLATRPSGPVTVTLGGTAGTDLSLDKTSLSFTASNWNAAQTVTVSAGDDADGADDAATLTHVASGGGYGTVSKDLPVTVKDDDALALVLSAASLEVPEEGSVGYTVKLTTRPTGPVTVTLGGTAGTDLSLDRTSLTFTVANWNAAQTVTVSAGDDADGADDAATLTHVASGGGYAAVSKNLPVTVKDDDALALVLSAASLEVPEEGSVGYAVKLTTRPTGPVTVTLGGTADTDLSLDETSLTFTAETWDTPQTVRIGAGDDDDSADDTATLTHTASGGGYGGVSKTLPVTVIDDDKPDLLLSVPSLDLPEGSAARYTLRLATRPRGPVTVALSCPPGTDLTFGEDRLTFTETNWDRAQTVAVSVAEDDDRTDDTETVTHAAAGGGYDGVTKEMPVKVSDNDTLNPDIEGWLARFGRSVAFRAVEMIASRMESGGGSRLRIAGQPVGAAGARFEAEKGLAAVDSFARPEPADRTRTMTARSLLLGSSFQFSAGGEDGAPAWSAWGGAAGGGFKASANGARIEGDMMSGFLGADLGNPRWTAGLAVGVSQGDGSLGSGDGSGTDAVEGSLTTIHPYGRLRLSERIDVWALLGYGTGGLTLTRPPGNGGAGERIRTDIAMRMGAMGARGELLSPGSTDGLALAIKSDLLWVRTESDAMPGNGDRLEGSEADVSRFRFILEGSREFANENGVTTPSVEIGVRHDGGDADTGTGLELGGSIRHAGSGFSIEAAARTLLAHDQTGYEEWGVSGTVSIDPGVSQRGLSIRIAPAWGAASSGVDRLWSLRDTGSPAEQDGFRPRARLETEMGYGFRAPGGYGTVTPRAGLSLAGRGERLWRLETRWQVSPDAAVSIEATRREAANDNQPDHGLTLRAALRW